MDTKITTKMSISGSHQQRTQVFFFPWSFSGKIFAFGPNNKENDSQYTSWVCRAWPCRRWQMCWDVQCRVHVETGSSRLLVCLYEPLNGLNSKAIKLLVLLATWCDWRSSQTLINVTTLPSLDGPLFCDAKIYYLHSLINRCHIVITLQGCKPLCILSIDQLGVSRLYHR